MPFDRPYYVVESRSWSNPTSSGVEYAIVSSMDGTLVTGSDLEFMHKVIDLLNEDINGRDVHR